VSPLRTGIGSFGGSLSSVSVAELGATVARAVVARAGLDPSLIEDVVFAQAAIADDVNVLDQARLWLLRTGRRRKQERRGADNKA
jgi:acetyl-CoA acetyltransferase